MVTKKKHYLIFIMRVQKSDFLDLTHHKVNHFIFTKFYATKTS